MKPEESWIDLIDFETGDRVSAGRGSVYWNDFRRRWMMLNSSTGAGEIWLAEADTPTGQWAYARRVVTHGDYNFYNPTQYPFFDKEGGRLIYFEGTYSDSFSNARVQTPRYDYNQIMYRLALDDPRLVLPVAVYQVQNTDKSVRFLLRDQVEASAAWERVQRVGWFAMPPSRQPEGLVSVYATGPEGYALSTERLGSEARVLFEGLPLLAGEPEIRVEGVWGCRAVSVEGAHLLRSP